jgi:threonine dehydrogenase-like Zn-dependent dehydrogenase
MGVKHIIEVTTEPLAELLTIFGGDLPTVVLDATGNAQSMMAAFTYVAYGGKLVYVGLFQGDVTFADPLFHRKELTLLASRNATSADFTEIIRLMEDGKLDTTPWITHRIRFDQLAGSFPDLLRPESGVIKAIVKL